MCDLAVIWLLGYGCVYFVERVYFTFYLSFQQATIKQRSIRLLSFGAFHAQHRFVFMTIKNNNIKLPLTEKIKQKIN